MKIFIYVLAAIGAVMLAMRAFGGGTTPVQNLVLQGIANGGGQSFTNLNNVQAQSITLPDGTGPHTSWPTGTGGSGTVTNLTQDLNALQHSITNAVTVQAQTNSAAVMAGAQTNQVAGIASNTMIAAGVVTNNALNVTLGGSFRGDGSSLTGVNAATAGTATNVVGSWIAQTSTNYLLGNTNYLIFSGCPYPPDLNSQFYWDSNFLVTFDSNVQVNGCYTNAYGWLDLYDGYSGDEWYQYTLILSNSPALSNELSSGVITTGWAVYNTNGPSAAPIYTNPPSGWADAIGDGVSFTPNVTLGNSAISSISTNGTYAPVQYPVPGGAMTIFPNRMFSYNGVWYSNFVDETITISNAWNFLAQATNGTTPGGNVCYFAPGLYQVGDFPLQYPPTSYNWNASSIDIEGAGEVTTVFLNTNTTPTGTFYLGIVPNITSTCVYMHNCAIATVTNAPGTVLLALGFDGSGFGEPGTGIPINELGGLAKADIGNVTFAYWPTWTNWGGILTPDIGGVNTNNGVVAIYLYNKLGDNVRIHDCHFDSIGAVVLGNDHGVFEHNMFESCGAGSGTRGNPLFPTNNILNFGALVNFVDATNNGTETEAWNIGGNEFACNGTNPAYLFATSFAQTVDIYGDDDEMPLGSTFVATTGTTKVNLIGGWYLGGSSLPSRIHTICIVVTNSAVTWAPPYQADNGTYCHPVVFSDGLGEYTFDATNTANIFRGSFSVLQESGGATSNDFVSIYGAIASSTKTNFLYRNNGASYVVYWTTNGAAIYSKSLAP